MGNNRHRDDRCPHREARRRLRRRGRPRPRGPARGSRWRRRRRPPRPPGRRRARGHSLLLLHPRRLPRLALGGHRRARVTAARCDGRRDRAAARRRGDHCPHLGALARARPARRPRPGRPPAHRGGRPAAGSRLPCRRRGGRRRLGARGQRRGRAGSTACAVPRGA